MGGLAGEYHRNRAMAGEYHRNRAMRAMRESGARGSMDTRSHTLGRTRLTATAVPRYCDGGGGGGDTSRQG